MSTYGALGAYQSIGWGTAMHPGPITGMETGDERALITMGREADAVPCPSRAREGERAVDGRGPAPRWVLPGDPPYTEAEGATRARAVHFFRAYSCFFGFGSVIWADAR